MRISRARMRRSTARRSVAQRGVGVLAGGRRGPELGLWAGPFPDRPRQRSPRRRARFPWNLSRRRGERFSATRSRTPARQADHHVVRHHALPGQVAAHRFLFTPFHQFAEHAAALAVQRPPTRDLHVEPVRVVAVEIRIGVERGLSRNQASAHSRRSALSASRIWRRWRTSLSAYSSPGIRQRTPPPIGHALAPHHPHSQEPLHQHRVAHLLTEPDQRRRDLGVSRPRRPGACPSSERRSRHPGAPAWVSIFSMAGSRDEVVEGE